MARDAIGERWTATLDGERIVAARIERDGDIAPGLVLKAEVQSIAPRMVRVRLLGGQVQAMLRDDADRHAEGQRLDVVVERAGWHDGAQAKLPVVRVVSDAPSPSPPSTAPTNIVTWPHEWPAERWDTVLAIAAGEAQPIRGGSLTVRVTPAMTVIDVDGTAAPSDLALTAARALAAVIRLLDLQGVIVVDLPTVSGKAQRLAIDHAIDQGLGLAGFGPVQRTGVNGFGLVQLIMPRRGASLAELVQNDPLAHAVRRLLWAGERCGLSGHGHGLELRAPPAVLAALSPTSLDALAARVGKRIILAPAPTHRLDDLAAMLLSA